MGSEETVRADAVVVGASVAGAAAATLLARHGAHVVVLDRAPQPEHFKRVCTHFLVPGCRPVLQRLGLEERMVAAGARPNATTVWTRWGTYSTAGEATGWNLTREKLDPMVREVLQAEPTADLRLGTTVTGVLRGADGRVEGVRARDRSGRQLVVRARLTVGADGRSSSVARLAGVRGRVLPHGRLCYFGLYEDVDVDESRIWFREPDATYVFPNEDGRTVVACFVGDACRPAFKEDARAALHRAFEGLPGAPDLQRARPMGPVIGKLDMPNVRRRPAQPGLAFVGDAAQASDPLWGVGVGFAFMSAGWLAETTGPALAGGGDLDAALRRYRRRHAVELLGHHLMMSDFATARPMNPVERLFFSTAPHHPPTATVLARLGGREAPLHRVLTPAATARTAAAAVRLRLRPATATATAA